MKHIFILCLTLMASYLSLNGQTKTIRDSLSFLKWAPTPPYGWNSWDCYGPTVVEAEVKANADYMAKYLKTSGWQYIVVDIRWYVDNDKAHGYNEKDPSYVMDEYGRFLPSPIRFPSAANGKGFKPLADYIHSKGLKFGIHIMRGIPKIAVKNNTPIFDSKFKAQDIYSTAGLCFWLKDMYTVDANKEGAQAYYNSLFNLYASWGLDFVKVDDLSVPYHTGEIEMIRKAIDNCGRKIVLSTSPGETPIKNADHIESHANMWRIVGDFWDNWPQFKDHFEVCNRWASYIGDGHFPDADMLPLGRIGIRAERGDNRMSALTKDEQISLMTLFAIFRSPLMFGGNLPDNDEFTLSLISNKQVLNVNQYSANNKQLFRKGGLIAWTADDPKTGDKYLALFNASDREKIVESKAIWTSEVISQLSSNKSIDITVEIKGAKKLYLVASDNGDAFLRHFADWVQPQFIGDNSTINLTDLHWKTASAGNKQPVLNKSITGKKLIINEMEYDNGIGTQANSIIEYDVPAGINSFKVKAGLDKDAITQGQFGANVKFMIFTQSPAGDEPADQSVIPVKFEQIGLTGKTYTIKDIWSNKIIGDFTNEFAPVIKRHAAGLYRISIKK